MMPEPTKNRLAQISRLPENWEKQVEEWERASGYTPSTVPTDVGKIYLGTEKEFYDVVKKYNWNI